MNVSDVKGDEEKKIKNNIPKVRKRDSIVTRISFSNAIIFFISFFAALIVTSLLVGSVLIRKNRQTEKIYITDTLNAVDNMLRDMSRVSLICFSDQEAQRILRNYESETYKQQLADVRYLDSLYTSLVKIRDDVKGIVILDNKQAILSKGSRLGRRNSIPDDEFIDYLKEMEEKEPQLEGSCLLVGRMDDYYIYLDAGSASPYSTNFIYLIRRVRSFSPYEEIGHIILSTPVSSLRDLMNQNIDDTFNYYLYDSNGQIYCSNQSGMIGTSLNELTNDASGIDNSFDDHKGIYGIGGVKYLVEQGESSYSDLRLMVAIPMPIVLREVLYAILSSIVISLVFGMATVYMTSRFTRNRLMRLTELATEMSNFSKEDLSRSYIFEDADGKNDEIDQLKASYYEMMRYINELVEKEYKHEIVLQKHELSEQKLAMLYLRNQVNPHFLYNTLDVIRITAAMQGDKKTADMLMQLVTFYRLSTRSENAFTGLREELKMLTAYLQLMSYRYPDIHYTIEVIEELLDLSIPSFILQPVVENSLLHGLRDRNYRGHILIKGYKDSLGYLIIEVEDDGIGMNESMIRKLNEVPDESEADVTSGNKHLGIRNVQIRLRMYYGEKGGLTFDKNISASCII